MSWRGGQAGTAGTAGTAQALAAWRAGSRHAALQAATVALAPPHLGPAAPVPVVPVPVPVVGPAELPESVGPE